MESIPGKACGPCVMCCTALEIVELKKPAGPACPNCMVSGGCAIYARRPQVCRDFECLWLVERELPANMRPDRIGALFMEDDETDEYRVVCAPERPLAWRNPQSVRPSGRDRQERSHRRRQGGAQFVAHLRLGRMGSGRLKAESRGALFQYRAPNFSAPAPRPPPMTPSRDAVNRRRRPAFGHEMGMAWGETRCY